MDFKLTTDSRNDLDIANGKQSFVTGVDATAQKVAMKLQAFVGECVYHRLGGTPWLRPQNSEQHDGSIYIFENTANPELNMRFILSETIKAVIGVRAVLELDVGLDRATRIASVSGRAEHESGATFTFGTAQAP